MKKRNKLNIALVQMASGRNKTRNIQVALELCRNAIYKGAEFIALPETFNYLGHTTSPARQAEPIPGPSLRPLMDIAKRHKVWIIAGSLYEKAPVKTKVYNSSVVIDSDGKIKVLYRKIHLFDVSVNGKKTLESSVYLRGTKPVLTSVFGIKTGMAICYDLRFPELFRRYSKAGAKMFCIPSSFTRTTGKAHWEALLRARAIENQCFVIAPNQCGKGNRGLKTYGNSMIVDHWGKVLARASATREEIVCAELDFGKLSETRSSFPALRHRILS